MTKNTEATTCRQNLILSSLPADEYKSLQPHLKEVLFRQGDVLHHSNPPEADASEKSVYFLDKGVASLSVGNSEGYTLELSIVGNESVIGERAIFRDSSFSVQCQMLSDGSGCQMDAETFQKEFYKGQTLHDLILNQFEARLAETSRTALCNHSHKLDQRFSRWLLTFADHIQAEQFYVTQELISLLLGVNRQSISFAAQILLDKGLIKYSRGTITIINRFGLESETCECYEAIKKTVVTNLNLKRKI